MNINNFSKLTASLLLTGISGFFIIFIVIILNYSCRTLTN